VRTAKDRLRQARNMALSDASQRLPAWGDLMAYIANRARSDWLASTGHDIEGDT
jgi:hypothetical protein